jgi:hypothetical protein
LARRPARLAGQREVYGGNCRTDQDADDNDARNGIGRNP